MLLRYMGWAINLVVNKLKQSLRTKLTISYVAIAVLCVVLISIFSNLYLEKQFRIYVKNNQERKNLEIVALITHQYEMQQGFNTEALQNIGDSALNNGLIVHVEDAQGNLVWDALEYNHSMCQSMMEDIHNNMMSRYPNWKGKYVTEEYPIMSDFKNVGKVQIGYYGPFYFTEGDLKFINSLNVVFIGVGVLALGLAIVLGNLIARGISKPIKNVISTAQGISKGNFDNKITERSTISEIDSLTGTINNMADILKIQEQLRKRLTADVAHELRTPLTTLQSHLEAMIDGIWEADAARLKSCHDEIIRISRLVGDLEKLARYEGQNIILDKTEFDLVELIKSIAMNFEKEMLDRNISISISKDPVSIFADRDKISQVMINLLSNAIKYSKDGDSVEFDVSQDIKETVIKVKDTGIGIEKEHLHSIFERFYRIDSSRSRITGGSGIGLTITEAIAEAHGGTIEVQSQIGVGTEFTVRLPRI
jgi:two-component system, OmpR family, sensor histidine kinase BaeS